MILCWREWNHVAAIGERDEADLFSNKKFLDDDAATDAADRRLSLRTIRRDDDALTGGETVRFDNDGIAKAVEGRKRLLRIFRADEIRCGNSRALEEVLGEDLAAFQLRGGSRRAHNFASCCTKRVDHSGH